MVLAPQSISLPAPVKRTVGVAANFLCDNSSYFLGIDNKGKSQRTQECFAACKALHESLLKDVDSPAAQAVLAFFRTWDPQEARENPALQEHLDGILAGGKPNFSAQRKASSTMIQPSNRRGKMTTMPAGAGPQGICLVTGAMGPIENIHPSIKNVAGAQSSGAALVSFNAPGLLLLWERSRT